MLSISVFSLICSCDCFVFCWIRLISKELCLSLWLRWKGRGMSHSDSLMAPPSQLTVCAAGNRHKKCGVKWEERKKQTDWVREQQVGWHNVHCSKTAAPQKQRVTFMWSHTTGADVYCFSYTYMHMATLFFKCFCQKKCFIPDFNSSMWTQLFLISIKSIKSILYFLLASSCLLQFS